MTMDAGITGIGQVAVQVNDLAAAVAFYRDVLGLTFLFEAPPGLAFFQCGATRIMLALPERADAERASSVLYYTVGSINAAARAVEGRGVRLEREPHRVAKLPHADLWMAFLRDPAGNMVGLMSEVPRP